MLTEGKDEAIVLFVEDMTCKERTPWNMQALQPAGAVIGNRVTEPDQNFCHDLVTDWW